MFQIDETDIRGFLGLRPPVHRDERGVFVKVFHETSFREFGLPSNFKESYYTISRRSVLRGMHFQVPPFHHAKLVSCIEGEILDVAVDLRINSPTFGRHAKLVLRSADAAQAYLAPGLAHGFYVLTESATVLYDVTTEYSPAHDTGIRWDSLGIDWPDRSPIVSERDAMFKPWVEFTTPFTGDD